MKIWFNRHKETVCRAIAVLLCMSLCVVTAEQSAVLFAPFLSSAARLSVMLSFGTGEVAEAQEGEVFTEWVEAEPSAVESEWESEPEESTESSQEESSTLEKPENAGTVKRQTYKGGSGDAYISLKSGYIKNSTGLSASEVKQIVKEAPAFRILADGTPEVLIMHSHATESYQPGIYDWYDKSAATRNTDETKNMCRVGEEIAKQLTEAGIGVIHDTTLHDYPQYNGSYERSAVTVKAYLKKYPTIKVVLDVHRDAIQPDDNTVIAPATTIDGKSCAQVMIISGADNGKLNMPKYKENLKFAAALQAQMEGDYPTLTRPVMFAYRKYNQDLTTGSLLLEMGSHGNSLDEAIYCGELVGKSLAKTLLALKS